MKVGNIEKYQGSAADIFYILVNVDKSIPNIFGKILQFRSD